MDPRSTSCHPRRKPLPVSSTHWSPQADCLDSLDPLLLDCPDLSPLCSLTVVPELVQEHSILSQSVGHAEKSIHACRLVASGHLWWSTDVDTGHKLC